MPLVFNSLNHGEVAFGFFNIETDMLLLENHFFFAADFCSAIIGMATGDSHDRLTTVDGYILEYKNMGNLMGAIAGVDLHGFIGDVYDRFPFPHEPEKFKHNPEGFMTRVIAEGIIQRYATGSKIEIVIETKTGQVKIGQFLFNKQQFHALLQYVWVGGYPRWKDEIRPPYVLEMKERAEGSSHPLCEGIRFI